MEIRSFLAFELPDDIKSEITKISGEVKKTGLEASWVKPDNIHLTVVFMGDVDEKGIPDITANIDSVTAKYEPFDILLGGIGLFPDMKRPRVMWLGLNGEIESLSSLRDDLQKFLAPFGIKQEKRSFKPHLTLGRFRKPVKDKSMLKNLLDEYGEISGPSGKLEELVLFKSELKPTGAVYTKLHCWPLGKGK